MEKKSEVRIAELKSRLSEHLRRVRAGRSLTVLDRDTPIARIVPWDDPTSSALRIRGPMAGATPLRQIKFPPALPIRADIVELLLAERQAGR
jgi:antitoxin (DNA-binding transcriptional repressor) of toxin-antitoxin stability system